MAWKKVVTESSADNIAQNAATVTSIGNLTGVVTSTNRATAIANGAISYAMCEFEDELQATDIPDGQIQIRHHEASGTASSSTFLRGDGTWSTPTDISALANLTDATIDGTPADGEMLVYDSTNKWQNQTLAETGIQPLDADLTALSSCQSGSATALALLTSTEVAILDGATVTTAELNTLNGFDGDVEDLKYAKDLYDTGVTATEFDHLDGVTSNIQTQLDAKQASGTYYTDSANSTYWTANSDRTIGNSGATLTVAGNLTVSGSTTTINTTELSVEDNIVILNSNITGNPSVSIDSGIEIERGDRTNTWINWDEGKNQWTQHIQKNSDDDNDGASGMIPMVEQGTGTSGTAHGVGNFYVNTSTDQLYVNVG